MKLAALLPHPDGLQFAKKYAALRCAPDAGKFLGSTVRSQLNLSSDPPVHFRVAEAAAGAADAGADAAIYVGCSYDDAAKFVLEFQDIPSDDFRSQSVVHGLTTGSNGGCVPALWLLVRPSNSDVHSAIQQAAVDSAAVAAAAAAAAGAGMQPGGTAAAAAAAPKAPKHQKWHQLADELVYKLIPCVPDPSAPRGIRFIRISQAVKLSAAEGGCATTTLGTLTIVWLALQQKATLHN